MILIVYHDPGDPAGHDIISQLANMVQESTGMRVKAVTISSVDNGYQPPKGSLVYPLFIARAGHYETVVNAAKSSGAKLLGWPSPKVLAEAMVGRLAGCRSVALVYWKAKRFVERQMNDLELFCSELENLLGMKVRLYSNYEQITEDCIVPLVFFPGRLSSRLKRIYGDRVKVDYILEVAIDKLAQDIASTALKHQQLTR